MDYGAFIVLNGVSAVKSSALWGRSISRITPCSIVCRQLFIGERKRNKDPGDRKIELRHTLNPTRSLERGNRFSARRIDIANKPMGGN
jgi:hypothetical protein